MDILKEILHEVKNCLNGLMLADENLLALSPIDGQGTFIEAIQNSREAWIQLEAAQKEFIKACEQARRDR